MKNLKYTAAYLIPVFTLIGIVTGGMWSFAAPMFAFVLAPIIDQFFPRSESASLDPSSAHVPKIFDWMLYGNVVLVYAAIATAVFYWSNQLPATWELVGQILSLGIVLGSNGINVAHELGHRPVVLDQLLSQVLLIPTFYMHFNVEHNMGHHIRVGTMEDPATSRKNEALYVFWFRSILMSYWSAWEIQMKLNKGKAFFRRKNKMFWFTLVQLSYLSLLLVFFPSVALYILASGLVGIILLETVNYIEHYGLMRRKKTNGRYENVEVFHSWNANYPFGRILLYELTRHSDHHYLANKPYPKLAHQKSAPELPVGYPAAMLLSFVPPLWFKIMNPRVEEAMKF